MAAILSPVGKSRASTVHAAVKLRVDMLAAMDAAKQVAAAAEKAKKPREWRRFHVLEVPSFSNAFVRIGSYVACWLLGHGNGGYHRPWLMLFQPYNRDARAWGARPLHEQLAAVLDNPLTGRLRQAVASRATRGFFPGGYFLTNGYQLKLSFRRVMEPDGRGGTRALALTEYGPHARQLRALRPPPVRAALWHRSRAFRRR